MAAGKKPSAVKKAAGKKPSAVKKAGASPSRTSSNEAAAIEMVKASAVEEMQHMTFWDLQEEVGVSLEKIKAIERRLAIVENRKMIISLKKDLAMEMARKKKFEKKVLKVSKMVAVFKEEEV